MLDSSTQDPKELAQYYKKIVHEEIKQKKVIRLTESDRAKISKELPQCLKYIVNEMPEKSERVDFNKLVVHLITYFIEVTIPKKDAYAKVESFILNYPHSATYNTSDARLEHWNAQWDYLNGNTDYDFKCSYIKGLGLPGHAFDCSKCIGATPKEHKTPSKLSSGKILQALDSHEDGDAELFIDLHSGLRCYDHTKKCWYRRKTDGHWKEDLVDNAIKDVKRVIRAYAYEIKRQNIRGTNALIKKDTASQGKAEKNVKNIKQRVKSLQKKTRKLNVLVLAASGDDTLGITGLEWDSDPWALGCKNGIVDLRTGEAAPITPYAYIRTSSPTEWTGLDVPCPTWEKFMSEVFNNDIELIKYLQRLFGYSLIGKAVEAVFPILWGEDGRNGKDTLFETLRFVLGEMASPIESEMIMAHRHTKRAGGPTPEILDLKGKRIIWASETEEGRNMDTTKTKFLTGCGTLTTRKMHKDQMIRFNPTYTLFLITNAKPKIKDGGDMAYWDRARLIELSQRFVKKPTAKNEHPVDLFMKEKLQKEAPGILAWLVRGCLKWQKKGFDDPRSVLEATEDYKREEDNLTRFLNECCVIGEYQETRAKALLDAYLEWGKENIDEKDILKPVTFYKKMKKKITGNKGHFKETDIYRDKKGNLYQGIYLKKQ